MTTDSSDPLDVPGLAPEVMAQIVRVLGGRAEKLFACLRTAAGFLAQAHGADGEGLRLVESACYNLREAFDAVVAGQEAVEGGLGEVVEAWRRYEFATKGPGADESVARGELHAVLRRVAQDEDRQGFRVRQLLAFVRDQTGVEPLPGDGDPLVQYNKLRNQAAGTLHSDGSVAAVSALYDDGVGWFGRFFTPPDDRVRAIVTLAEGPYDGDCVGEARDLVVNAHDLRLFFEHVQDPAWLDGLFDAGLISLPRSGEPWPVATLGREGAAIGSEHVGELLLRLWSTWVGRQEPEQQLGLAREIVICASRLGAAGHEVIEKVLAKHQDDYVVLSVAESVAKRADPRDPIQLVIARSVVDYDWGTEGGHYTRTVLGLVREGLTPDNVLDRMKMLAGALRRHADAEKMRYVVVDIAALSTDGDDLRETALILAQQLTKAIPTARTLGLPTHDLLAAAKKIPGALGERVVCQVLAGTTDIDRQVKIDHVAQRMASATPTGDDRDLIEDILTTPLSPGELERWQSAFGQPSPQPDPASEASFGDNWPRGWRWSILLPEDALEGWEAAIEAVTAKHGKMTSTSFDVRSPQFWSTTGGSPHSHDEIAGLPVADAAALVSSWRPSDSDEWGIDARELARTLEAVVRANPLAWTDDPTMVVSTLREPIYVDHYFRGVTQSAAELTDRANAVLAAVKVVRADRWEPTPLGRDDWDYEPNWSVVETVTVKMIEAFASHDADIAADLDYCWELTTQLGSRLPDVLPDLSPGEDVSPIDGPLTRAINQPYGQALEAALALGAWEHRHQGTAATRFTSTLDGTLSVRGAVGLELRSILARSRRLLEAIALDWLETNADGLFGRDPLGLATFDQTLMWSQPTKWFYDRYRNELVDAARRGARHSVDWLLIALLRDEPDYTFQTLIDGLRGNVQALRATANNMAGLLQSLAPDDAMLDRGLQHWEDMLAADRNVVPAKALLGLGRWAFVEGVDDPRLLDLIDRTLAITGGEIDMANEIAARSARAQPSSHGLRILRTMIGHGEPWVQHQIETEAIEALKTAATHPVDNEFDLLRDRLIERGRHEAAAVELQDPDR